MLDACAVETDGGRRWIGYASDLASFDATSSDGATAALTFDSPITFSGSDADASVVVNGPSTAFSAIVGDQNVEIVVDDSIVRTCTNVDLAE